MIGRNRRPNEPDRPQHFDLGEIRDQHQRDQANAIARQANAVATLPPPVQHAVAAAMGPQRSGPSPLVAYLDALNVGRPLVRAMLPPVELAADHDVDLAELLQHAKTAHGAAVSAAMAWQDTQPGGAGFTRALNAATNADAIVDLLTGDQARRFAAAFLAQRQALDADQAARDYAAKAVDLRDRLDAECDRLAAEIIEAFDKAAERKRERYRDDAAEIAATWRDAVALLRWVANPARPFKPLGPGKIPQEAHKAERAACEALGIAVDGDERSTVNGGPIMSGGQAKANRGEVPTRKGLFRRVTA